MPTLFSFRVGARAERAAARHLRRLGHTIVERNVRLGHDEIDIISTVRRIVVFTEVRFRRGGIIEAAESVGAAKKSAMQRAARHYIRRERLRGASARIDLILMTNYGRRFTVTRIRSYCEI